MKESINRLDYIDVLKGFGIALMVLGHMWFGQLNYEHYIYAFHMPLFFLISGYLYRYPEKLITGIKKKAKSLLIPYFVFGMGYFMIWMIVNYHPGTDWFSPFKSVLLISVEGIPYNIALWFLMTMFWAWLFYTLLLRFIRDTWIRAIVIIALSVLGAMWGSFVPFLLPWGWQNALAVLVFFWIGHTYHDWKNKSAALQAWESQSTKRRVCFIIVGLILNAILIYRNGWVDIRTRTWATISATYFNAVTAVWLYTELVNCAINHRIAKSFLWRFLRRLGQFSIVWLCINQFVIEIVQKIVYSMSWSNWSNLLTDVIIIIITFIVIYLIAELIMGTPLRVLVGKWKPKTVNGSANKPDGAEFQK